MRICMYTETALPKMGGQEMVVDALARQYQRQGHDVVVLAPHPRLPLRANDATLPYPVVRHPRFYSTRYFVAWYRWWLLRLKRTRPFDILHCHGLYPSGYLAALAKERLGVPIVLTSHGGDVHRPNVRLAKPVLRERHVRALAGADAVIAISRFTEDGFHWLCPEQRNIVTIPNGVDLSYFTPRLPMPDTLGQSVRAGEYFLFLGRLKNRKGVDLLLEAAASLNRTASRPVVVLGAGEEREALEAQSRRLGLEGRVFFLGLCTHPAKTAWLQNAFCTVVPSRTWESFGLVVLESYAAGVPVIATDLLGLSDLIRPEETGLIVPPESAPDLAAAMAKMCADPERTRRMGERAHALAKEFSWENIAGRHLELFEQMRGSRRLAA